MCMNSAPHGAAIDAARFVGEFAFDAQAGMRHGRQESQRIEISFEVSIVAKRFEHTLPFAVRSFEHARLRRIDCQVSIGLP